MSAPGGGDPGAGTADGGWRPSTAFVTALAVGTALLVLAAATHRPALALLATPLLAEVAWALRPFARPPLRVALAPRVRRVREGDELSVDLAVDAPPDADAVLTAVEYEPLLATDAPLRPLVTTAAAAGRALPARAAHWGRAPAAQAYTAAWAAHGLLHSAPALAVGAELVVEPGPSAIAPVVASRWVGIVGPRPSRRPGTGSELTGVRPFVAGDRLRHVHWRVTARRGDLHVTTTTADRETSFLLLVDAGSELGARGDTSLDRAVRGAAALARQALWAGDRVGLVDLTDPLRVLRPGAGRRHLDRVVDRLVGVRRRSPADLRRLPELVATGAGGAVAVVLSPLLRPEVGAAVAHLARTGTEVTVVDTLGDDLERRALPAAHRLLLLERDTTLARLAELGVVVRPWR